MAGKKFLIIQLYSNGDCLYVTTVARQLKTDFPECMITWAVAPFCAAILDNNPYIDTVWTIDYMPDRQAATFRNNRARLFEEAKTKGFDDIFFTQIIEENFCYYDGLVRSSLYAAFGRPITVPKAPVLVMTETELTSVQNFVKKNDLEKNNFVILFECAPLSGQLQMDIRRAFLLSERIIYDNPGAAVILSSSNKISSNDKRIIDGSVLSLRETAALTHYCHFLIGCSSGITWAGTSSAAKQIPSLQLLNKKAYYFNSPRLDHIRQEIPADRWLELYDFDDEKIIRCICAVINNGFDIACKEYGQTPVPGFRIYRGIVHQFIQHGQFRLLGKFIRNNRKLYGFRGAMIRSILTGVVFFPVQYLINKVKKK